MAKILTVNSKTKDITNNIGDIVVVFEDSQVLTDKELENFDMVLIPGTAQQVIEMINSKMPEVKLAWKDISDGLWKELKEEPSFQCRIEAGLIKHNYGIKNTKPLSTTLLESDFIKIEKDKIK